MLATSPGSKSFFLGQLVTSNFDGDYRLTYSRVPFEETIPNDVKFNCGDVGLILSMIDYPDSFYTNGFAMILIPDGSGWVPFRWLKSVSR